MTEQTSEPRTEAGRRLLDLLEADSARPFLRDVMVSNILDVEADAAALPATPDVVEALRKIIAEVDNNGGQTSIAPSFVSEARRALAAALPAAPAGLDVERLARALHSAQPHWDRHRTTFENHRDGHVQEAEAIAAAYVEGEPTEAH